MRRLPSLQGAFEVACEAGMKLLHEAEDAGQAKAKQPASTYPAPG
jgi:hypothetical protein